MGCMGNRRKAIEFKAEQKWDYINLQDFRSKGCGTPTAYAYLWFSLVLSIALYAVDTFTAVNLLVFDRWSSDIKPAIDINISKYIFAVCIILSIVNLAFEWVRAARVMKRGNIAECYLDNLAARWESIRMGSGQGWRRFLVFAELTKNKKGAEYVALFTYLNLQSWIRVLLCTGPRQVVNAFTLKAVYESDLLVAEKDVGTSITTFFSKLQVLAEKDYRQAVILSGMVFTLVIWVFSVLFLLASILAYVLFLFHWIPRADGGLTGYCERKINKALLKIVTEKVNKALARQEQDRFKAEAKVTKKKNGETPPFKLERAATLPTIPDVVFSNDKLPEMPSLTRAPTIATLPEYSPGGFEFGGNNSPMDQKRPGPTRTNTAATSATYSSKVSLLSGAADMGFSGGAPPPLPRPTDPYRPPTSNSMRSMAARNMMAQQQSPMPMPTPMMASTYAREYTETPMQMEDDGRGPFGPPVRSPTAYSVTNSVQSYGRSPTVGGVNGYARPPTTASAGGYGRPPTAASMASGYGRPPTAAGAGGYARPMDYGRPPTVSEEGRSVVSDVGGYARPPVGYGRSPTTVNEEDGYGRPREYGRPPTVNEENGYGRPIDYSRPPTTVNEENDYGRSIDYGRPPTTVNEENSYGRSQDYGRPPTTVSKENGYGRPDYGRPPTTVNKENGYGRSQDYSRPPTTANEENGYGHSQDYGRPPTTANEENGYGRSQDYGRPPITASEENSYNRPPTTTNEDNYSRAGSISSFNRPFASPTSHPNPEGRSSPVPSMYSTTSSASNMRNPPLPVINRPGFPQPIRSATNPMPPRPALYSPQPRRNMTGSAPPQMVAEAEDYHEGSVVSGASAAPRRGGPSASFDFDLEGQGGGRY